MLRAAYSSTIARPGFNQSNPALAIDLGSSIVTSGNPNLKPATSNNFDFSIAKYLPNAGVVSLGVFDKQLSNYIVPVETNTTFNNGLFLNSNLSHPLNVFTYANRGSSYARGMDVNWNQQFVNLPGWLSGFGASANYTWVDSRIQIRPGEYSMLPSTSKNTWNIGLTYTWDGFKAKIAGYSTSADLFGIGTNPSEDVYNAKRTSMDFEASDEFAQNWTVYFAARNLLDTPHTFYQGTSDRPIQREFYGVTYLAGVRFQL